MDRRGWLGVFGKLSCAKRLIHALESHNNKRASSIGATRHNFLRYKRDVMVISPYHGYLIRGIERESERPAMDVQVEDMGVGLKINPTGMWKGFEHRTYLSFSQGLYARFEVMEYITFQVLFI